MSASSIAQQVNEFNVGFEEQIGDRLAAVFAGEQSDLRDAGLPAGVRAVGEPAPEGALLTPEGSTTSLSLARGEGAAVVVFYRGAWCPYCNITLRTYQQELLPVLRERGAQLIAISPQTPDGSVQAVTNGALEFTVLSDPSNALAEQFGIVTEPSRAARSAHTELGFDVADSNADGTARIPFPSVFVLDADGIIRFADIHVDYTTRTEPREVLAALSAAVTP